MADVREQLDKNGIGPMSMTAAEFSRFIRGEITESMRIVKRPAARR